MAAAYLQSWVPVLQSILPRSGPSAAPLPEIGAQAPALPGTDGGDLITRGKSQGTPTLVAFVRHCGCPFAEKEAKLLAEETKKHKNLHVIIVQHSEEKETEEWFERIGAKAAFTDSSRYTLIADPSRELYAAWGIGVLPWTGMVNGNVMGALKSLKESDGIDLTPTGKGSWRWQNSGGFAVDSQGVVKWRKVAVDSSDMCDYSEAAGTVV
ncbi:hypothetical protein AAFC00_004901 [Neodothiora populina]|uniref:Alkyl hydroperoxide reductase subunit C/ Thiol specific antioxidant domain-containing protein n=1 Tax=Neodothiora populina TaxID=2781224 RepID=A0ABR3P3Z6_9PEZI